MAKLSDRLGIEHIYALGAGTNVLKDLAENEEVPGIIREMLEGFHEMHAEACQIIVQIINEELEAR